MAATSDDVPRPEEIDVTRRMAGYELRLGEHWTVVPDGSLDVEAWAMEQARGLVGTAVGMPGPAAAPTPGQAGSEPAFDPVEGLAEQIAGVVASVRASGVDLLTAAFLTRRPELGVVDAMVTVVAQEDLSAGQFVADLERLVAESDETPYLFAQAVEGSVGAGEARGMHLMIGHLDPDLGHEVAHLEERVALGVFPPDCPDMIEVTAVASGIGVFDDMAQAVLDLVDGLTVELATS